jgi:hypothetical protein
LIGYENRVLRNEDFNNDLKDAGDMGAGHTVTALFEVVPAGVDIAVPGVDPLKYQTPQEAVRPSSTRETLTLKIRYKEPEGSQSKLMEVPLVDSGKSFVSASTDYRFASSVAAFGMILRDSPYKGSASISAVLDMAEGSKGQDRNGYRAEFIGLVNRARSPAWSHGAPQQRSWSRPDRAKAARCPRSALAANTAHTITMTYRVSEGALEVRTRLDNLSNDPMPVVIGFHPIYELPDGNRNDWTVSLDAKTHWIEIPQRLPTGETQPIESFFGSDRTAIQLKKYGLIDDVFTDLVRDANGRATMKLMYNGKELHAILGPKYRTVLAWSTALPAGGGGTGRAGGQGGGGRAAGAAPPPAPSGPFPVDPAQGVKVAPAAVPPAEGAPAPTTKGFIAFEPMVAITNALNLAHKGVYKDLQSIPPGGSWEESLWVTTRGY